MPDFLKQPFEIAHRLLRQSNRLPSELIALARGDKPTSVKLIAYGAVFLSLALLGVLFWIMLGNALGFFAVTQSNLIPLTWITLETRMAVLSAARQACA